MTDTSPESWRLLVSGLIDRIDDVASLLAKGVIDEALTALSELLAVLIATLEAVKRWLDGTAAERAAVRATPAPPTDHFQPITVRIDTP